MIKSLNFKAKYTKLMTLLQTSNSHYHLAISFHYTGINLGILLVIKTSIFQEFGSTALDFVEDDPMTLKEVHEHMIRSPPPISCWPHGDYIFCYPTIIDFSQLPY